MHTWLWELGFQLKTTGVKKINILLSMASIQSPLPHFNPLQQYKTNQNSPNHSIKCLFLPLQGQ